MYLGTNGTYQFFSLELDRHSDEKLKPIVDACEKVEAEVWNACEDFFSYVRRQSALIYAKRGKEVVAFALFDIGSKDKTLVFAANECMVLKKHQGNGLPTLFMAILISHIRKFNREIKNKRPYRSVTFVASTVHFKLMQSFKRYGWLAQRDSFRPDEQVLEIASDYIKKEKWKSLSEDPFFIESAFPNAVKLNATITTPTYIPTSFEASRGDAFLYVCRITNFTFLGVMSMYVRFRYGFHFSKNSVNISRLIRDDKKVIYTKN